MVQPLPQDLYGWPVIGEVARWLNQMMQAIQDELSYWFRRIWELIPKPVRDFIERVRDFLTSVWDRFVKLFTDPIGFFRDIFDALWELLPPQIKSFVLRVHTFIDSIWSSLYNFLRDPVGALSGLVNVIWASFPAEVRNWISSTLENVLKLPGIIVGKAQEIVSGVTMKITEVRNAIEGWISGVREAVNNAVTSARDRIMAAFDGAQTAISSALMQLGKILWDGFWHFWTVTVPSGLNTIFNLLSPTRLLGNARTLMGIGRSVVGDYVQLIGRLIDKLVEIARRPSARDPIANIKEVLATAADVVTQVEFSTIALELALPWKYSGLGGSWGAALLEMTAGAAVGGATGSFLEVLLRGPTKWANENFRGNFPALEPAVQMYYRNLLSLQDIRQILVWQGFDDVYINAWLKMITERLPPFETLSKLYFWGFIGEEDLRKSLQYAGIHEKYIPGMLRSIYTIPPESQLTSMWFRGIIDEKTLDALLRARGYQAEMVRAIKEEAWFYPSVRDLITFFVREAIPAVHGELARAKLVGLPREMYEYARKAGIPPEWVEAYWASHWQLPGTEQVYRMLWRGLRSPYTGGQFTITDVERFLAEADVDPRWRTNLVEIAYDLPGRIVARWGLEWGIWDERRFEQFLRAEGLHPDWIPDVIAIEKKNVFREHINAVMSAALRMYKRGYITREEFQRTLQQLGFPDEVIKLRMWQADLEAEAELRDDVIAAAIAEFRAGKIGDADLRHILSGMIVIPERLDSIVRLEVARAQRRAVPKPDLQAQLERLQEREADLSRRLADLESDLENARRLMEAEMRVWDAKIEAVREALQIETRPARVKQLQDRLELLEVQKARARIGHENRMREIQETIGFVQAELEDVRSKIAAIRQAMGQATR